MAKMGSGFTQNRNALIDIGSVPASRLVARFSCNLTKESPAAVRSYGLCVIIHFAPRRKTGWGNIGGSMNASGAD